MEKRITERNVWSKTKKKKIEDWRVEGSSQEREWEREGMEMSGEGSWEQKK